MITFNQFLKEQYELAEPNFNTIEDFLQSITTDPNTNKPLTLKQFADKASWLSLYSMNKHGIGSAGTGRDEKLAKLIKTLSLFFHQNIMWPLTQPLRDKLNQLHAEPEFNKKRRSLFKQKMMARREGDDSLVNQIEDELSKLQNPHKGEIIELDNKVEDATKQALNTLITSEYFTPQSEEAGQTYQHVYKDFEDLKN